MAIFISQFLNANINFPAWALMAAGIAAPLAALHSRPELQKKNV
jgi:hypothetical protein|tara:strand:- start:829 stop:960 length:132 start_codon:yes stop_codon:yes gene_type:complete